LLLAAAAIAGCPAAPETAPVEAVVRAQVQPGVTAPKKSPSPGETSPSPKDPASAHPGVAPSLAPSSAPSAAASPGASASPGTPRPLGSYDPAVADAVVTYAGTGRAGADNGVGLVASFQEPQGVAVDDAGRVYVAEHAGHRLRLIDTKRAVTLLAGDGKSGSDNGAGAVASFNNPMGLAVTPTGGRLVVADYFNNRLRELSPAGQGGWLVADLTDGAAGPNDVTGQPSALWYPTAVAIEASGSLLIADSYRNRIRRLDGTQMTTLPGWDKLERPAGVAVDAKGHVYIADTGHHRILKLTVTDTGQSVSVLAGTGQSGLVEGPGAEARFNEPRGLAVTKSGTVYVADAGNHSIRQITTHSTTGAVTVSTVAGTGSPGYVDGARARARFNRPTAVAVDTKGHVYVADSKNHAIRRIQ
jgi:sugar lactone lactonase YvrE